MTLPAPTESTSVATGTAWRTWNSDHFAFVVGDVSGRGIDAVAVMASARFTLRAYLLRGDTAATALGMCSRQFDVTADGHIATAVVGIGNWRTGEVTVANAGHCLPLLLHRRRRSVRRRRHRPSPRYRSRDLP